MRFKVMPQDRLALDRASARVFDDDGHLKVRRTPISKANVCEYLGSEIPGFEDLGLAPDRRYKLLRDPGELQKAAETFDGKPLLFDHNPVSADEHDHDRTVGSVSNPVYEHPYLYADLACWSGPAIRAIEDGSQKELSSAYRYEPDMTAGTFEGARYDGVMRNIAANHVALVKKGRAGPDVVVGDSALRIIHMPHTAPTRFSAFAQGAVSSYAHQKIAQDAKINLAPLFDGLTAKNFKARKPVLSLGLKGALSGKLAADEDLDDVDAMLDRVEAAVEDLADTVDEAKDDASGGDEPAADDENGDVIAFLTGKISDEDLEKVKAMLAGGSAAEEPAAQDDKGGAAQPGVKSPAMDAAPKVDLSKYVTKHAQDAAISRAVREATAAAVNTQRGIFEALNVVRPHVGEFAMDGVNDASDVYRTALVMKGEDVSGIDPSAYPALFRLAVKQSEAPKPKTVAQDAASIDAMKAAFPNAFRLNS